MKPNFLGLLLLLLVGITLSCKSEKTVQTQELVFSFDQLVLGWGGGFTGKYEEYRISKQGVVETKNFDDNSYQPYSNFNSGVCQLIYSELDKLNPWTIKLDEHGNLSQYIEISNGEKTHRIVWTGQDGEGPEGLQSFFVNTQRKIRSLK